MANATSTSREVTITLELTEEEAQVIGAAMYNVRQTGPGRAASAIIEALESVDVDCEAFDIECDDGCIAISELEDE